MIIRDHMPRSLQELLNKDNFHGSKSAAQAATWSYMVGTAIASESLIPAWTTDEAQDKGRQTRRAHMIHMVFESRLGTSAITWVLVENEREMQKGRSVRPCLRVW